MTAPAAVPRSTHAYGPSALQARCGAREVYCSVYARDVTCESCQRLRDGAVLPPNGGLVVTMSYGVVRLTAPIFRPSVPIDDGGYTVGDVPPATTRSAGLPYSKPTKPKRKAKR